MTPLQQVFNIIVDAETRDICSVSVAPAAKSKVKEIVRSYHLNLLEEVKRMCDGKKEVYTTGDRTGQEKDHCDCCCNETIDEIISTLEEVK